MHDPCVVPELYFRQWGAELDPQMWERGCFLERHFLIGIGYIGKADQ